MATVRRHAVIARPAEDAWRLVGDPAALAQWWPGIVSASVEGSTRTIVTGTGLPMPEEIVTCDPLLRRFQYRITAPLFQHHLSTLDVIALTPTSCIAVYGVDAKPDVLALAIGGAAGAALQNARAILESTH